LVYNKPVPSLTGPADAVMRLPVRLGGRIHCRQADIRLEHDIISGFRSGNTGMPPVTAAPARSMIGALQWRFLSGNRYRDKRGTKMWDTVLSLLPVPQPQAEKSQPEVCATQHATRPTRSCGHCGALLIGRDWYELPGWGLGAEGRCLRRGTAVASAFEAQPSAWGPRSHPVQF
jgi:hypothetical protein